MRVVDLYQGKGSLRIVKVVKKCLDPQQQHCSFDFDYPYNRRQAKRLSLAVVVYERVLE